MLVLARSDSDLANLVKKGRDHKKALAGPSDELSIIYNNTWGIIVKDGVWIGEHYAR